MRLPRVHGNRYDPRPKRPAAQTDRATKRACHFRTWKTWRTRSNSFLETNQGALSEPCTIPFRVAVRPKLRNLKKKLTVNLIGRDQTVNHCRAEGGIKVKTQSR